MTSDTSSVEHRNFEFGVLAALKILPQINILRESRPHQDFVVLLGA
jgi:hypothetical protein